MIYAKKNTCGLTVPGQQKISWPMGGFWLLEIRPRTQPGGPWVGQNPARLDPVTSLASRNTLITMEWRGISRHHIWWIVNVTFAICQCYMRCTCDGMLRMSTALRLETWILSFQVWGSWTFPLSISISGLLGRVIFCIVWCLIEQWFLLVI